MNGGQTSLETIVVYGWAILILLLVVSILWYYGVFDPSRYLVETRFCPSTFKIIESPILITDRAAGTGTLSLLLVNVAGQKLVIGNITLGGDIAGSRQFAEEVKAGDSLAVSVPVSSGLNGESGTRLSIIARVAYVNQLGGLAGSVACRIESRTP